jgi:hypothetical protein
MQLNGIKDLVPAAKQFWFFLMKSETTFKTLVASIQTSKLIQDLSVMSKS